MPFQFTALAISVMVPSWWSTAAMSVASNSSMSGQLQVVDDQFGQPLQASHQVIGEEADHAGGQRRKPRCGPGGQQLQGGAQRLQRVASGGRVLRRPTQPHRLAVAHGQADGAPAPMNDHRDHERPFSADSSRNVPGRLAASLR